MAKRFFNRQVPGVLLASLLVCSCSASVADNPQRKPSGNDAAERAFVQAVEDDRFGDLDELAKAVDDPLIRDYAKWWRLQRPESDVTFTEIAAFLSAHPEWPRSHNLRRNAEELLDGSQDSRVVAAWFEENPPLSGVGAVAHLTALADLGRDREVAQLAPKYWVEQNLTAGDEHQFLHRFGKQLDEQDHVARLDRLIWDRVFASARRMYSRVSEGHVAQARARIALADREAGVDAAIERVPENLRNAPELAFERLRWRRQSTMDSSAAEILSQYPDNRPRPELWTREARILARRALEDGHYSEAARLAAGHTLDDGGEFAESEFLAGWIRLTFLREPNAAEEHFHTLYKGVSYPISQARAAYWKGAAAAARGNPGTAQEWWEIASRHSTTFYGQEARRALGRDVEGIKFVVVSNPEARKAFAQREVVRLAARLHELGAEDALTVFFLRMINGADSADERLLIAEFARELDLLNWSILAAKRAHQINNVISPFGYPVIDLPADDVANSPDAALTLSIIRQESAFSPTAVSGADARGLMQLLPRTAKEVADDLALPFDAANLTRDPQYNIRLGRAYLADLLQRFDGSVPLALAAYNAGASRVYNWMEMFGDPRTDAIDMVNWIESIPFSETRNYVQRITEARVVYDQLLANRQIADRAPDLLRYATSN